MIINDQKIDPSKIICIRPEHYINGAAIIAIDINKNKIVLKTFVPELQLNDEIDSFRKMIYGK